MVSQLVVLLLSLPTYIHTYIHTHLPTCLQDQPAHALNEAYDCTSDLPISKGLPYLISSHTTLATPSDEMWEEVEAALPFGQGYADYWLLGR